MRLSWSFIFDTDERLFDIINRTNRLGKSINEMPGYRIGQGLNLQKAAIFSVDELSNYSINSKEAIPFFVTEESGVYIWERSNHFIVDKHTMNAKQVEEFNKTYILFDSHTTKKVSPVLIMPRGIGARHFCCYNAIAGFSASCVDLYSPNGTSITDDILRLWLYMNSSLFWLIRETAGRTNLGGGMLKAEAIDVKPFAIFK